MRLAVLPAWSVGEEVSMSELEFSVVILAAGKATRFKSERPKVLHPLAGRRLGDYVIEAAQAAEPQRTYVIIGHQGEDVCRALDRPGLKFITQTEQLGTGHALMVARRELEQCPSPNLVVLVGDAPLVRRETLRTLVSKHVWTKAAATILTTQLDDPTGYGRVMRWKRGYTPLDNPERDRVRTIVEERLCTPRQKATKEVSSGILCFDREILLKYLEQLSADNAQKEYLLTDLIEILNEQRYKVIALRVADWREVLGVNDRVELARVEKTLRLRKAETLMRDGVTIVDPHVTYIDDAVQVGQETVIEPGVSLLGSTRVGRNCLLRAYSTITDSTLDDNVTVRQNCVVSSSKIASGVVLGPFAHLRDGAVIAQGAELGNFVEVKKSWVGQGSKARHLTYLGDATLGEQVNVGAGTVTCNYDGEKKNATQIEDGAFIGSGTMLVAPVRIGKNSYVAAGSTITDEVPAESLALGRARQINKEGWARERAKVKDRGEGAVSET
jgi:bifunctional UDP-N-acetylglucosamine pyrophosphorylase / glucosamine-1-phosphate N-acetyltransferase